MNSPTLSRQTAIRRPDFRLSHLAALLAAATVAANGCATKNVLHPPTDALRAGLGAVSIVALSNARQIAVQIPDSKADVAAEEPSFEVVTPRMVGRVIGAGGDPFTGAIAVTSPLFIMGSAPLWQEARRVVCTFAADSAADVARARATLDSAIAAVDFESVLRDRLSSHLAAAAPAVSQVPFPRDADTILELMAFEPGISGGEGTNPGLALCLGLRVRLVDVRTRQELYYDYLDYRSIRYRFVEWAADDARVFHAELERSLANLSSEIVAQLFIRPAGEFAGRRTLATAGLSRRPPTTPAPNGGMLWSPPFRPARYARR
jgi:hypothetical protein